MDFPSDRKYTKEHEWVALKDGNAVVGITEFAQQELGDIVFVELPEAGKGLSASETICVVKSTKAASDVYSPITGTVQEVNQSLQDQPELINQDCYEKGWMVSLKDFNQAEVDGLMDAEQYKEFLGDRV